MSEENSFIFSTRVIHFKNIEGASSFKNDYLFALIEKVSLFLLENWEQGA
jgi:hypothetical protein